MYARRAPAQVIERYVYDGQDIALEFNSGGALTHRYLHGPMIDQVLADEYAPTGEVLWALSDNLGTVRDWVESDGDIRNHLVYGAFGNVIAESGVVLGDMNGDGVLNNLDIQPFEKALANPTEYQQLYPAVTDYLARGDANRDGAFNNLDIQPFENLLTSNGPTQYTRPTNHYGFTGREQDPQTGLQYNRARYYDAAMGRWISEDPIGFAAGDANLNRYVENSPTDAIDPAGHSMFPPPLGSEKWTPQQWREYRERMRQNIGWDASMGMCNPIGMTYGGARGIWAALRGLFRSGIADDTARVAQTAARLEPVVTKIGDLSKNEAAALRSIWQGGPRAQLPLSTRQQLAEFFSHIAGKTPASSAQTAFNRARADYLLGRGPNPGTNVNEFAKRMGLPIFKRQ